MVTSEGAAVSKLSSFQVPDTSSRIIPLLKDGSRSETLRLSTLRTCLCSSGKLRFNINPLFTVKIIFKKGMLCSTRGCINTHCRLFTTYLRPVVAMKLCLSPLSSPRHKEKYHKKTLLTVLQQNLEHYKGYAEPISSGMRSPILMIHMDPDLDQKIPLELGTCPFSCDVRKPRKSSEGPLLDGLYGPIMEP